LVGLQWGLCIQTAAFLEEIGVSLTESGNLSVLAELGFVGHEGLNKTCLKVLFVHVVYMCVAFRHAERAKNAYSVFCSFVLSLYSRLT
jgi:hypothetical protein